MVIEEAYKVILTVCSILTFCMSIYFWFMPKKVLSNKVLGVLSFIWASILLIFVLQSKAFFCQFPHLYGLGTGSTLLFFPLMFLFAKSYLDSSLKVTFRYVLHLLPFVVFLFCYSPFYFQSGETKIEYFQTQMPTWLGTLFLWTTIVMMVQGVVYSLMSLYLLQGYNDNDDLLEIEKKKWLKKFVIFNTIIWAIGVTAFLFESLDYNLGFDLFVFYYFGLTSMAFWVGYVSLQKPDYFSDIKTVKVLKPTPVVVNDLTASDYEMVGNKEYTEDVINFIRFFEETKPYLDTQLNLQKLSTLSGLSRNYISEMLNNYIGKSFYDFINEYRIKEFISLVDQGLYEKHTLTYLYESAGFNSKATFNRFFKKQTGLTPTSYIQQVQPES